MGIPPKNGRYALLTDGENSSITVVFGIFVDTVVRVLFVFPHARTEGSPTVVVWPFQRWPHKRYTEAIIFALHTRVL